MRLLERLYASKLSLCVIRHVRRTGGRALRWLVAISHTALIVVVLVVLHSPGLSLHFTLSNSHCLARSRQMCLIALLPVLPLTLTLCLSRFRSRYISPVLSSMVCISHDTLLASALLQASLRRSSSLPACLLPPTLSSNFPLSLSLHCS